LKKLRVAVVGLGIGQEHLKAYLQIPTCEIVALSDLNQDRIEAVKLQHGLTCPALTFEEIANNSNIDIVSLASFDSHHASQLQTCLRNRKHVFVEKPFCRSQEELEAIVKLSRESNCHVRSNLVLRSAPLYLWLKEQIGRGEFGQIYSLDADYLYGRLEKITEGWRKNEIDYSVFAGGAVHMADIMLSLLGERPSHVICAANKIVTKNTEFKYVDFMTTLYRFPSGVISRVNANFGCVHPHQHFIRLYSTKKTFILDDAGPRIFGKRGDNEIAEKLTLPHLQPSKGALIKPFVESILNNEDPHASFKREVDLMSVVLAADLAYKNQGEIKVEYLL
jgi:predicted dehydrogenase